jgi:hypothetical protein
MIRVTPCSFGTNAVPARFKVMNASLDRPRNRLLLALPSRNLKRLMPELEHIRCQREQVSWTLIVRSTMSSSPTVVSSR